MQNGLAAGHTLPQPPQLLALSRLVVQPFCGLEQAAQPSLHTGLQALVAQVLPLAFVVLQVMPQPPQFALSALVAFSQPLFGSLSQSEKPVAQLGEHAPPLHSVVPCKFEQAVPHPPQFAASFP